MFWYDHCQVKVSEHNCDAFTISVDVLLFNRRCVVTVSLSFSVSLFPYYLSTLVSCSLSLSLLSLVYSQSLAHILQVLAGPIMQLLENELSRNKALMTKLTEKREQLKSVLALSGSNEDDDLV